jgi:hypothetical protein
MTGVFRQLPEHRLFEDSPLGLDKWFATIWMVANCKNGISSYEMARDLGITQKSAWFMDHRIRLAMKAGSILKMDGDVEADESFMEALPRICMRRSGCTLEPAGPRRPQFLASCDARTAKAGAK